MVEANTMRESSALTELQRFREQEQPLRERAIKELLAQLAEVDERRKQIRAQLKELGYKSGRGRKPGTGKKAKQASTRAD